MEENNKGHKSTRFQRIIESKKQLLSKPGVSFVKSGNEQAELVYDPQEHKTAFLIYANGDTKRVSELMFKGQSYIPYSPENNLIRNGVVLLPSKAEEYGSEADLLKEIQAYLRRYVDISPRFEQVASHYVLLSWLYDAFNELPYLRARGDFGSGKTRFLIILGSICYKPIFASGASTISPLFRILDAFRGTLIVDEGDFRYSDERSELTKILNNGNAKGFPVLRSESIGQGEYNPRAYTVFGPKIVGSRGLFEDRALESRFLTEEMGTRRLRKDIPLNLPESQAVEALTLRNKLLMFRFRNLNKSGINSKHAVSGVEPRISQIFAPLLSVIKDDSVRSEVKALLKTCNEELRSSRSMDVAGEVLQVIHEILQIGDARLTVSEITRRFAKKHAGAYERRITSRWIGQVLRTTLHLKTHKSNGVYGIVPSELPKLEFLFERYGVDLNEGQINGTGTSGTLGTSPGG